MKTSEALARLRGRHASAKPKDKLSAIAALINAEHKAVGESLQNGLRHAVKVGELLIKVKALLSHGQWLPWVEKNCDFNRFTAARYMQTSQKLSNVSQGHISNYREALRLLSAPDDSVHFSSESPEWYTPPEILDRAKRTLRAIELDPCSDGKTVPASKHFTKADDGLARPWFGTVYMNPPYGSEIGDWVEKLCAEYGSGNVTEAIALVPARVDTEWWRRFEDFAVCFVNGRLKFSGHENSAPFPSALVYIGKNVKQFRKAFEDIGSVWMRLRD